MKRLTLVTLALAASLAPWNFARAQIAVKNQGYIPYSDAPIYYRSENISDAVTLLQKKLDEGKARLEYREGDHGYLKSVLELLDIPVSSQTLVFSKTSFQYPKISPRHPRALYFNDDIYIGVVHEGKEIEVVSFDKQQGAMFFHPARAEGREAALRTRRARLHPVPHRGGHARRSRRTAALGASQCHRHAGVRREGVRQRPGKPARGALGRLVCDRPAGQQDHRQPRRAGRRHGAEPEAGRGAGILRRRRLPRAGQR
jgi:hypothetical protein